MNFLCFSYCLFVGLLCHEARLIASRSVVCSLLTPVRVSTTKGPIYPTGFGAGGRLAATVVGNERRQFDRFIPSSGTDIATTRMPLRRTRSSDPESTSTGSTKPPVECAKCGHLNSAGTNSCVRCHSRIYIACHRCGHSNARVASQCSSCGHRLHRPFWRRLRRKLFGRNPKITPFQIILLLIFVFLGYKVIVYLAEYKPPVYQGE